MVWISRIRGRVIVGELHLDPRPGSRYSGPGVRTVEPDVYFVRDGEYFIIQMNDDDLPQLRREAARPPRLKQPRHLHGQGRAAGDDAATFSQLQRGTAERNRIDAVMVVEPAIFIGEQHFQKARVDIADRCRQSPTSVLGGVGAQVHHPRHVVAEQVSEYRD